MARLNLTIYWTILYLFPVLSGSENTIHVSYPDGNQILFDPKGFLVNKIAFIHVKFIVDMQDPLKMLDKIILDLNEAYLAEVKRSNNRIVNKVNTQDDIASVWGDGSLAALYNDKNLDGATVCLTLLEVFLRISIQLKGLLTSVPEKYDVHGGTMIHDRTKRAVGLLAGGVAIGISLWNSHKISVLEKHLTDLSSKYNKLIDSTVLLSEKHNQLAADVEIMARLIKMIASSNYRKILATAISAQDQLRDTIDNVVSIVTDGRQKRVSPRLVNGDDLAKLFLSISRQAKDINCEMILTQPSDLYEVEASYGYSKEGLVFGIYLHVPVVPKSEKLALLEHIPFPIYHQSFLMNSTLTPQTGLDKFLAVLPTSLATQENGIASHKYRVLSEVEFQSCHQIRDHFLCAGRNTLRTDIDNSCIGSLWLKDKDLIKKNCDIKIEPLKEVAAKLSPKEWLIFSPELYTAPALCGKNIIKSIRFEHQTRLRLAEDCDLSLKHHILTTDVNIMEDFKIETHEWRYFDSIFDEVIKEEEDFNEVIKEISSSKGKYGLNKTSMAVLKHHVEPTNDQLSKIWSAISNLNIFAWFGNVYTFLAACLIIFVLYLAITRGWFKSCFSSSDSGSPEMERPMRPVLLSYRPNEAILSAPLLQSNLEKPKSLEEPKPPPYSSLLLEEAGAQAPSAPFLDEISNVTSNESFLNQNSIKIENEAKQNSYSPVNPLAMCVVKSIPRGRSIQDFICNHHAPGTVQGCSGYFKRKPKGLSFP